MNTKDLIFYFIVGSFLIAWTVYMGSAEIPKVCWDRQLIGRTYEKCVTIGDKE